jgi:hypothetical protein
MFCKGQEFINGGEGVEWHDLYQLFWQGLLSCEQL